MRNEKRCKKSIIFVFHRGAYRSTFFLCFRFLCSHLLISFQSFCYALPVHIISLLLNHFEMHLNARPTLSDPLFSSRKLCWPTKTQSNKTADDKHFLVCKREARENTFSINRNAEEEKIACYVWLLCVLFM